MLNHKSSGCQFWTIVGIAHDICQINTICEKLLDQTTVIFFIDQDILIFSYKYHFYEINLDDLLDRDQFWSSIEVILTLKDPRTFSVISIFAPKICHLPQLIFSMYVVFPKCRVGEETFEMYLRYRYRYTKGCIFCISQILRYRYH